MYRIGLTGGIASGKTTIANMFGELGAVLIDTDVIARQVVARGTVGLDHVVETFGADVLDAVGALDRRQLREIVFADESRRRDLEAILHPLIREETQRQMQQSDGPYQVIVVPLLVESPLRNTLDRIVVVDCPEDVQLERLLARDAESSQQARRIIQSQASRAERLSIADDVIVNDGSIDDAKCRVRALHDRYLEFAAAADTSN